MALVVSGCFAPVAGEAFAMEHDCATAEERVVDDNPDNRTTSVVEVTGCGHDELYNCTPGYALHHSAHRYSTACSHRPHVAYQATDGTEHVAWDDDVARLTGAILSAVHDLPCPSAAIRTLDN